MRKFINTSCNCLVLLCAPMEDRAVCTFAISGNLTILSILDNPRHHFPISIKFKTFQTTVMLLLPKNLDSYHLWVSFHKRTNPLVFAHLQQDQLVLAWASKKAASFLRLYSVHVLAQAHTPYEIFHLLAPFLCVGLINNFLSFQAQSLEPELILSECPSLVTEQILDLSQIFMQRHVDHLWILHVNVPFYDQSVNQFGWVHQHDKIQGDKRVVQKIETSISLNTTQ